MKRRRMSAERQRIHAADGFAELVLGMTLYPWQVDVLRALTPMESRVALRAANGSGKTSVVACAAVMWHMCKYPGSLVVCTAGVYRQVRDALWPHLRKAAYGMGGEDEGFSVTEGEVRLTRPSAYWKGQVSRCIGFSAETPEKAEGWHRQGEPEASLLYIIDEGKAVQDGIFQSMERCQPSRVLLMSSPGGKAGQFYEAFTKNVERWKGFVATAFDCPHITKEQIKRVVDEYGENHPLVRSSIHAEFIDGGDGAWTVFKAEDWQRMMCNPPVENRDGPIVVGLDFAAGGDETVMHFRKGNCVLKQLRWKESDTMAGVGRIVNELRKEGVDPANVWADNGGLGASMCDRLREVGVSVNRVNFGDPAIRRDRYVSRGAEMWMQLGLKVEKGEIVLGPVAKDDVLLYQFLNRQVMAKSDGKLRLQGKDELRSMGLPSPDRADAMVLAWCGEGADLQAYGKGRDYMGRPLLERVAEWEDSGAHDGEVGDGHLLEGVGVG